VNRLKRWQLLGLDYLLGLPGYAVVLFFMIADNDLHLHFTWSGPVIWWTVSYVVSYPLMMAWLPKLRHNHLAWDYMTTTVFKHHQVDSQRESYRDATSPVRSQQQYQLNQQDNDNLLSSVWLLIKRTIFIAVSIVVVIITAVVHLFRR